MSCVSGHFVCRVFQDTLYVVCFWTLCVSCVSGHFVCHVLQDTLYVVCFWTLCVPCVSGHFDNGSVNSPAAGTPGVCVVTSRVVGFWVVICWVVVD